MRNRESRTTSKPCATNQRRTRSYSSRRGPKRSAISPASSQRWKSGERLHGGGLLRRLLAPADAAAEPPPPDRDLGHEALLVVGPALLDQRVGRSLTEEPLGQLLELGLVVAEPDAQVLEDVGGEVR